MIIKILNNSKVLSTYLTFLHLTTLLTPWATHNYGS